MPIPIPPLMAAQAERPHQDQQWIWCWEIEAEPWLGATAPVLFRFTSWQQELVWPVSLSPTQTWYPAAFAMSPIQQDGEGSLPQVDLTFDNATRAMMPLLHSNNGLEGNRATLFLLNAASKDIAYPNHEFVQWTFAIAMAEANDESVTFRMEVPNFFQRKSPQDRYVAARCRWQFGGPECGYIANAVAGYSTCNKTVSDCVLRGDDEVGRNLPRLHPARFGGFPGIPAERAL